MEVIDDSLVSVLLELLEQVLLIDDDLVFGRRFVIREVVLERVGIRHVLNREWTLLILLQWDLVQRQCRNGCIGVLLALGNKDDEVADVLFQLGQVLGHILFVELGAFIVLHRLRNREFKVGLAEFSAHILNVALNLAHL